MNEVLKRAKLLLSSKKRAYDLTFDGVHGQQVLSDLAKFCRATETTFHSDQRLHAVLEGRREVFLRIQKYLQLTPDQLWELTGRNENE